MAAAVHRFAARGGLYVEAQCVDIAIRLFAHLADKVTPLSAVMNRHYNLLKSNGDEQADDNRRDMDNKILPRVNRLMGSVNIKHRGCNLRDRVWLSVRGTRLLDAVGGFRGYF